MAEQIMDGIGSGNLAIVDDSHRLWVNALISGGIHIGSVSANVDSIYVQSGDNININKAEVYGSGTFIGSITSMPSVNVTAGSEQWIMNTVEVSGGVDVNNLYAGSKSWIVDTLPDASDRNNEAWKFEYETNNNLGSITQFIGAGSYVSVFTWEGYSGTAIGIGSRVTNMGSWA
jgi:hypothetical protein